MQIKKFNESFGDLPYYEVKKVNNFGEEIIFDEIEDHANYDPFDLDEAVKLYMQYEGHGNFIIKKITEKVIDKKIIEKIKLKLDSEKYNL